MHPVVRRGLVAFGVVLTGLALAMALSPGLAGAFTPSRIAVWALAGVSGILVAASVQSRRFATRDTASLPAPESRRPFTRPGATHDRLFRHAFSARDADAIRSREHLHDRLRSIAVGVVMRRENCSAAAASDLLDAGDWTDDRFAARYFAGRTVEVSARTKLRLRLRGETLHERTARHAVDELARDVVDG